MSAPTLAEEVGSITENFAHVATNHRHMIGNPGEGLDAKVLFEALEKGAYSTQPSLTRDLVIDGVRFRSY